MCEGVARSPEASIAAVIDLLHPCKSQLGSECHLDQPMLLGPAINMRLFESIRLTGFPETSSG